jgi:hypothetical protein
MALPEHVTEALGYIRDIKAKPGDKLFLARCWINRSLSPVSDIPKPVCWAIRAPGIAVAEEISRNIKVVYDHSTVEDIRYDVESIMDRAVVFDLDQTQQILGELSIPVFFNSHYHDMDDILIVPLSQATGFSRRIVSECEEMISELNF